MIEPDNYPKPLEPGQKAVSRMIGSLSTVGEDSIDHDLIYEVLYWIDSLVVVINPLGYITIFNRASERLSGYCFEELKDRPFWDILILPEERRAVKATIIDVAEKGLPNEFQNYWRTKDGNKRLIRWKNSILRKPDGSVVNILCTGLDITDQYEAEAALRESETKYRELVQNANSIILRMDTGGRITFFNEFAEKFFGYNESEILGQSVLGSIVPETDSSGKDLTEFITKLTQSPEDYINFENENICRNGERAWIAWTNRAIRDDQGHPIEILAVGNDITQRKKLERQLQNAKKMEALGTLAGGIAHDLNNILTPIIGYTELALCDIDPDSILASNIVAVIQAGKRARDLVKQILTFSRRHEQETRPIQLSTVVQEALQLIRVSCPATIKIRSSLHQQDQVLGDPSQLHQVVMNLCTNSLHAMGETGGSLEVTLNKKRISNKTRSEIPDLCPGLYLELQVSDSGPGMPPTVVKRIFDPFYSTKKDDQGTGLGLSVVHGIVHNHRGEIKVTSSSKGTTFQIYIPVFVGAQNDQLDTDGTIPIGTERILFIDDEQAIVQFCKQMLKGLGYQVTGLTDGHKALKLFNEDPDSFDIVITDLTMPSINGDDLVRSIWQIRPDIPSILCTGFSAKIDRENAIDQGFSAFIDKPVERRTLARTIRRVLDGHSTS